MGRLSILNSEIFLIFESKIFKEKRVFMNMRKTKTIIEWKKIVTPADLRWRFETHMGKRDERPADKK